MTAASNLTNADTEVLNVVVSSNVTLDGYCIVRVKYFDGDLGLPVLSRLEGNLIEPVEGIAIASEPRYTHTTDFVFSSEEGLLVFVGLPNSWHDVSLVNVRTGEVSPMSELDLSLDAYQIVDRSGNPVGWKDFHFSGAQSLITLRYIEADNATIVNVLCSEGRRQLEIDAYPYAAWLLSQDDVDVLLLTIRRPSSDSTYELMRLHDLEGNRLDEPKMEIVTLSPEFWQMTRK